MGMTLALYTISDDNIDRVLADPPLIWRVIAPDFPEMYRQERAGPQPGMLARLFGAKSIEADAPLPDLHTVDGEGEIIDIDKSWHGIHYLLTGTTWEGSEPLNFIVAGGAPVGDIDVGYGPARVLRSDAVAKLVAALNDVDAEKLRERFNPEEMMNLSIYPEIWDREPNDDDVLGYCVDYYEDLRKFLSKAMSDSLGIVLHIG